MFPRRHQWKAGWILVFDRARAALLLMDLQNGIVALFGAAASGRRALYDTVTQIVPQLAPASDEDVFRKRRVGASSTTDLGARLAARGIDALVLSGLATSGVVLSMLRDGADRDFRLLVLSECCDDPDPEIHRILMEKAFPRQAQMISLVTFVNARAG